jgi:hypothetical protein
VRTDPVDRRVTGAGKRAALLLALAVVLALTALTGASPASAASPWWHLTSYSRPAAIEPEGTGTLVLTASNLGDAFANADNSPIAITDTLPPGLKPTSVEAIAGEPQTGFGGYRGSGVCPSGALTQTVTCTFSGTFEQNGKQVPKTLPPYDQIEMIIHVQAQEGAHSGEHNELSISGGEAAGATIKPETQIGVANRFGVEDWELTPEEEGGAPTTQAGQHPFQVTGSFTIKQDENGQPIALPKELNSLLPPGLVGNPTPLPQCTLVQFLTVSSSGGNFFENLCAEQTAVGVAMVTIFEPGFIGATTVTVPIYNVEPNVGEAARFGFILPGTPILLNPSVRTGGDYGITLGSNDISQTAALLQFKLVFWGVPGDPRHDNSRGLGCIEQSRGEPTVLPCIPAESNSPPPFLSMPTTCNGPLQAPLEGASWSEPTRKLFFKNEAPPLSLDGCNRLSFEPSIRVTPDGTEAASPTGLTVDVHVPQDSVTVANGLAESNVRTVSVTLPEGVRLNPSAADGLQACPESLIGYLPGETGPSGELLFTAALPEPFAQGVNFCPDASKVATVKISSPLLPGGQTLNGAVYLATPAPNGAVEPGHNPFDSTVALYIEAFDPISGTLVKLPGRVTLDQSTGRISTTFENTPQLAFEDAEIRFFGGERAPLATPSRCGSYTTEATFTPWSGNPPVISRSTFNITTGPHGRPCPGTLPFSPSMNVGSPSINAGGFSPLVTTISRDDGQQNLQTVQLHMAPGMSGILAGVPLCPEAQANLGICSSASQIGETIVSVGVGGEPYTVTGGKVYLTEHYGAGQFGLSIVNPAVAGPFDLGKVVVRASIQVDPSTAQLTIVTTEIPKIIDGFPLEIKHVNVNINRPGFTFNPTSCSPMAVTGTIGSWEGASSPLSTPFQVTNCAALKYSPSFSTTTAATATKTNGASLNFRIAYPKNAMGSQAWFNFARFQIPKQLPARLTTIQKACLATTFEHDRAACPAASIIGHALVHTQVLPVPLEGPVYFVSYGGAKFPDAVLVLKGYGITIELHGHTFINGKTGVTTATFESLPDVPFENIEVTVPQGPFSEFGANLPGGGLNFCGQKLTMPVSFRASNGREIHQNTTVGITGCPKTKTRAQQLAAALKACHKKHGHKRAACERAARKHYGAKSSRRPSRKR